MNKVLKDIRVLDLGNFITAPYAAMLLAEMGADTVKVERPGAPDPFRFHTLSKNSPFFLAYNRNKRAVSLDYATPEGRDILYRLVKTADVFIMNVRPGVPEKLGIDAATLQKLNPRLIYCSITGFGGDGPYAGRPAFDGVGQTLSGLLSRFHDNDDPRVAGTALSDSLTGLTAALGILGALHERDQGGKARVVEVNMLEAAMAFLIEPLSHFLVLNEEQPFWFRGAASQAYILKCRDGKRVGLHMSSPAKFWEGLAKTINRPDLLTKYPTVHDKQKNYEAISRELAGVFVTRDRADWLPLLEVNDVPFAPENTLSELEQDPQVQHLKTFNQIADRTGQIVRGVNRAVRFDGDNESTFLPPPDLGEHTGDILAELGISQAEVSELRNRKVI